MPLRLKQARTSRLFLLGGLLGAAVFLAVFGFAALDPGHTDFCLGGFVEQDIQQHYAGWLFLRQSPLSFPFCIAQGIDWPNGLSVAYTDSIPLFAAMFRLVSGLLPASFQYFGLFTLLCYFLQGGFAALLLGLFWQGTALPVLGSLFFSISPVLLERTLRHTALAAHFFVLAALYCYFSCRRSGRCGCGLLWGLNALTLAIHPYLVPMTYAVTFALLAEHALQHRRVGRPLLFLGSDLAATLAVGSCFGLFSSLGTGGSESLYGYFSMNLNALWNPASVGGTLWSAFLPAQNQIRGNYDAFNYLGAAMLLLALCSLVYWLAHARQALALAKRHWGLLFVCACLTLFAVSNQVTANGAALFTLPLPTWLVTLCSVFRSGGRLFWPVYYLIFLTALWTLRKLLAPGAKRWFPLLLGGALLLQTADLAPAMAARHRELAQYQQEFPTQLTSDFWELAAGYRHICSVDGLQADPLHLALYAAENGMTTNDPFAARYDAASLADSRQAAIAQLEAGQPDPETLYLIQDEGLFLWLADGLTGAAWCGCLDGSWYVIAPGLSYDGADAVAYGPDYPITCADYTDANWEHGVLTQDRRILLFYDSPLLRRMLEGAEALVADGTAYPILEVDDSDAGWLMLTLDIPDGSLLAGLAVTAQK